MKLTERRQFLSYNAYLSDHVLYSATEQAMSYAGRNSSTGWVERAAPHQQPAEENFYVLLPWPQVCKPLRARTPKILINELNNR
jgi:hypothetical protein